MKKVLLASAYMLFLKRNTTLLMRRGFQIFTAKSGAEAFKLHKENHFDLILLDFKLEEMSGCTFCSLIRKGKDSPRVPIIMTCHNIPGSIESIEQSGADIILVKPLEPIKLMENIGSFLDLEIGRSKRVILEVKVASSIHGVEFFCLSHDISNTGILLETDYDLGLGSRIVCQFSLTNICQIEAEGVVTRFMTAVDCKNLYGVKFVALPLSCRKNIDNYIASMPATMSESSG
jgi:CheY-like chemotaxis protein